MALTMNPEVRTQWCAALRSEEYPQGKKRLRNELDDGTFTYCCLGVLTDLAVKAGVTTWDAEKVIQDPPHISKQGYYLSPAVMEWAGLDSENPVITAASGETQEAGTWNDQAELPFAELADAIEGDGNAS